MSGKNQPGKNQPGKSQPGNTNPIHNPVYFDTSYYPNRNSKPIYRVFDPYSNNPPIPGYNPNSSHTPQQPKQLPAPQTILKTSGNGPGNGNQRNQYQKKQGKNNLITTPTIYSRLPSTYPKYISTHKNNNPLGKKSQLPPTQQNNNEKVKKSHPYPNDNQKSEEYFELKDIIEPTIDVIFLELSQNNRKKLRLGNGNGNGNGTTTTTNNKNQVINKIAQYIFDSLFKNNIHPTLLSNIKKIIIEKLKKK